ncbi:hypothetical protein BH23PLA1_BH23PLA1_35800 [soil metagenome]
MPDDSDDSDVQNGPLAKAGPLLIQLFLEHRAHREQANPGPLVTSLSKSLRIEGESVGVQIRASKKLEPALAFLRGLGLEGEAIEPRLKIVEGLLPIAQLPAVAASNQIVGIAPSVRPVLG